LPICRVHASQRTADYFISATNFNLLGLDQ